MTDIEGYGMGLQTMWERVGDVLVIMTLVSAVFGALHQLVIIFFSKMKRS